MTVLGISYITFIVRDLERQSLYFHDFDNHLFELHAGTLDERLAAYAFADAVRVAARAD